MFLFCKYNFGKGDVAENYDFFPYISKDYNSFNHVWFKRFPSFYSDFTFGCWVDDNFQELVPIGKAYSGYTNDELKKLDLWVRNNTSQRFGPVRSVKPGLVVEISFDNINFSSRHKSGLALRFPRFSRIRWDKPISEVHSLKYVKDLIN